MTKIDQNHLYKIIGYNIYKSRKKSGFTQELLAMMVGLSRPSIVMIESGKQHVNVTRLYSIADALSIEITDLLPNMKELGQ